jgi:hypothetical protein
MDVWCSSFFRVPGNIIRKWAEEKRNEGVLQLVIAPLHFICPQGHFLAALHICLSISHPTVAHFSRCQCGLAVWEWAHCSLWYISRYRCSYHVRQWNSHIERSFPPFVVHRDKWVLSSPEMVFGPRWTLSLLIWLIQIWCNKFGEACFDNNIACSNNCCSKQDIILHKATKQASRDDFIPLAKETYSCLHPHFDSFLLLVYMLV